MRETNPVVGRIAQGVGDSHSMGRGTEVLLSPLKCSMEEQDLEHALFCTIQACNKVCSLISFSY